MRVRKGVFMANLLLHYTFRPFLFLKLLNHIHELSPPNLRGYVCQFFALRHVSHFANEWLNIIPIDNLYQKYTATDYVCQFGGAHNVGKYTFQEHIWGGFFLHMSFGRPGPLRTPFELKI